MQDLLGIDRNGPVYIPVEHSDSYAGSPGDQQKQTSLIEHYAGIVVKKRKSVFLSRGGLKISIPV